MKLMLSFRKCSCCHKLTFSRLFQQTSTLAPSVFRLLCRAKHWPSSYCFTPNDHQVSCIFLVLIQPIRHALSKWPFWCWFCLHLAADNPFLFAKTLTVLKNDWKNSQNTEKKCTQVRVIDKSIICSVDVSLHSWGAKTRQNLQSTVPSAAALWETICFCLSDGRVSQYLGAGKATFCLWQLYMQA